MTNLTTLSMEEICRPNLGEYLRSKTVDEVNDATHCPLNWEDGHEGISWLSAKLDEDEDLAAVDKFKHAKRYDSQRFPVLDMFPFENLEQVSMPRGRVFFVDIGGGEGWPIRLIRQRYENLVVAGEWVLQEHAENLEFLNMDTLPGVHLVEWSFFEPQRIRGRQEDTYITLHDTDEMCRCRSVLPSSRPPKLG